MVYTVNYMFPGTLQGCAKGPVNSILCSGEILTVITRMSIGYIISSFGGGGAGVSDFLMSLS